MKILDVCCGSKMFWYDKEESHTTYMDIRNEALAYTDRDTVREVAINPDIVADFRNIPFADNSFDLVVFDPPHLIHAGANSWLVKKYGKLNKDTWKNDLKQGFDECMRVLKPNGTMLFKWNEDQIKIKDVFAVFEQQPILGDKRSKTRWSVFVNEKALKNSQFAKWFHQQMGYVFQNADTQLFCGSVEEEIAFGPVQMGLSEAEIKKRTEDCLHLFGLEKLRDRPPYHLSGGEKRKVSLACILSLNPEVLILDEPLAGLDEKTQDMLVEFLQSFHKAGKTLITITHNRQLAETIGTRFACMNEEHELKMLS